LVGYQVQPLRFHLAECVAHPVRDGRSVVELVVAQGSVDDPFVHRCQSQGRFFNGPISRYPDGESGSVGPNGSLKDVVEARVQRWFPPADGDEVSMVLSDPQRGMHYVQRHILPLFGTGKAAMRAGHVATGTYL
jgi:hypothetical protein